MQTRNNMDYIYLNGTEQVLIESEQAQARSEVIGQYKQCRKDKKMTQTENWRAGQGYRSPISIVLRAEIITRPWRCW